MGRRKARRRWVEDYEFGEVVARMIRAYGRRLEMADAEDLPQLARLSKLVDDVTVEAVAAMRRRRVSWSEIGEAFGVTKQAAQQRWGR